jgi:cardiolipin synthase A/B
VKRAEHHIDLVIFRFDRAELEKALEAAVARGVPVRALIAHTNRGGEKSLRKLELKLLAAGVTVSRTADDLPRYHGKMMIVDDRLYLLGFNYTKLDIEKSRSFGVVTRDKQLVKEAVALFDADDTRQAYAPACDRLVVSPETSRRILTEFIKGAKKQLLIYDEKVTDNLMQRVLQERVKAGVEIRIIGKIEKNLEGIETCKLPDLRLHVRAMVRDGSDAFVGSQSLRKLELDGRREIGVIVRDTRIAKKIQEVFEEDWKRKALSKKEAKEDAAAVS